LHPRQGHQRHTHHHPTPPQQARRIAVFPRDQRTVISTKLALFPQKNSSPSRCISGKPGVSFKSTEEKSPSRREQTRAIKGTGNGTPAESDTRLAKKSGNGTFRY